MLIYENIADGVRHLFGTTSNIPNAADSQLTYKDADGDTITPVENDTYVDGGSSNGVQRIVRMSDGKAVNVFIGATQVIGDTPVAKVLKSISVKTKPAKLAYTVNDTLDLTGMVVNAKYESGETEIVTGYTTSPADEATLTTAGDVTVTVSYTEGSLTKTATFKVTVAAS